ncbi:MAG: hypothetical protein GTO18_09295 [Anaerolineales bacterium]|nr:hypothetical protein [Anaerolineales bacterium]
MFALGIREVQGAFDEKADEIQREFVGVSDELSNVGRKLLEIRGPDADELRVKQKELRARQQELAEEINLWRERSRAVLQQRTKERLKLYLEELQRDVDEEMRTKLERAVYLIDAPDEVLDEMRRDISAPRKQTEASRLIERARTSYDLRGSDPVERQRAAVQFANRAGMAQDDDVIKEIEGAMADPDPLVSEVAILTAIQLHRFRALRVADLTIAHESVKKLAKINHIAAIPILIEVLENPRTGFVAEGEDAEETDNSRSRMVALLRLVEWHTSEAQNALRLLKFDQNKQLVKAAQRSLELFPGEWTGPLKKTP